MQSADCANVRVAAAQLEAGQLQRTLDDVWAAPGSVSAERLERGASELGVDSARAAQVLMSCQAFVRECVWRGACPAALEGVAGLQAVVAARLPAWTEASVNRAPGLPKLIEARASVAMMEAGCDGATALLSLEIEGVASRVDGVANATTVGVEMSKQQLNAVVAEMRTVAGKLKGLASQ